MQDLTSSASRAIAETLTMNTSKPIDCLSLFQCFSALFNHLVLKCNNLIFVLYCKVPQCKRLFLYKILGFANKCVKVGNYRELDKSRHDKSYYSRRNRELDNSLREENYYSRRNRELDYCRHDENYYSRRNRKFDNSLLRRDLLFSFLFLW